MKPLLYIYTSLKIWFIIPSIITTVPIIIIIFIIVIISIIIFIIIFIIAPVPIITISISILLSIPISIPTTASINIVVIKSEKENMANSIQSIIFEATLDITLNRCVVSYPDSRVDGTE